MGKIIKKPKTQKFLTCDIMSCDMVTNTRIHMKKGQTVIEYTFCMIIILLLIYGAVMALRWAGVSLAERRITHDETLGQYVDERWTLYNAGPMKQVSTDFYKPSGMNMVFNGW